MRILVTGVAGFIGFHIAKKLCFRGDFVLGIDNLNDYYDVDLKKARLNDLNSSSNFQFIKLDIADRDAIASIFANESFDCVVHMAAQAGVRYSIDNPNTYVDSNLVGFLNVLEGCRHSKVKHFVYASSSSVYGANKKIPFSESDNVDHPVSLYAATKKANEAIAHSYSHLYNIPTTGLRFFTVYGPWGRPDMSPFIFAKAIINNEPIKLFNYGKHSRDFTYIDDIVLGVLGVIDNVAKPNPEWCGLMPEPSSSLAPWRIYNIGNGDPVDLEYFIDCLEDALGQTTERIPLPMQPGDVEKTYADLEFLKESIEFQALTPIREGVNKFVSWYQEFYGLKEPK